MKIDGRRVQGSRTIAQELERLQPEPPLFPADPESGPRWWRRALRRRGAPGPDPPDHVWAAARARRRRLSYSEGARLGLPHGAGGEIGGAARRPRGPPQRGDRRERRGPRWRSCRRLLQRVDDVIAAGTIDGEELNAADFQIAASMRLPMTMPGPAPADRVPSRGRARARGPCPEFAGDLPADDPGVAGSSRFAADRRGITPDPARASRR